MRLEFQRKNYSAIYGKEISEIERQFQAGLILNIIVIMVNYNDILINFETIPLSQRWKAHEIITLFPVFTTLDQAVASAKTLLG